MTQATQQDTPTTGQLNGKPAAADAPCEDCTPWLTPDRVVGILGLLAVGVFAFFCANLASGGRIGALVDRISGKEEADGDHAGA